jgi:hypothetical protein
MAEGQKSTYPMLAQELFLIFLWDVSCKASIFRPARHSL